MNFENNYDQKKKTAELEMQAEAEIMCNGRCGMHKMDDARADILECMKTAIDELHLENVKKDTTIAMKNETIEKLTQENKIQQEKIALLEAEKNAKDDPNISENNSGQYVQSQKTKKGEQSADAACTAAAAPLTPEQIQEKDDLVNKCEQLQKDLKKIKNQIKRVSNSNTPPSLGSEAQSALKKYRSKNRENYHDDKNDTNKSKDKNKGDGMNIQVTSEEDYTVDACPNCGDKVDVKTETKDVVDIPEKIQAKKTRNKTSKGVCKSGHKIDTTPKGLTRGTSFGPNLMTHIVYMFFTTLSLSSIARDLQMFGIVGANKSTVLRALTAVAFQKFASRADHISNRLGDSFCLMADEARIKIGKKQGWAWVFIGQFGIKIVISASRAMGVIDEHCPHFHIPITVDGLSTYNKFEKIQRCWSHILREAELLAATRGGDMAELHQRLQCIFRNAKRLPPDISEEELKGWIDHVTYIAQIYTNHNHTFGVTLRNAASNLFTFVRYPSMEPTNNRSERALRRVVLHRKIRLMFRTITGMKVYGILMTCMMTWYDQDEDLMKKIHECIMAN